MRTLALDCAAFFFAVAIIQALFLIQPIAELPKREPAPTLDCACGLTCDCCEEEDDGIKRRK